MKKHAVDTTIRLTCINTVCANEERIAPFVADSIGGTTDNPHAGCGFGAGRTMIRKTNQKFVTTPNTVASAHYVTTNPWLTCGKTVSSPAPADIIPMATVPQVGMTSTLVQVRFSAPGCRTQWTTKPITKPTRISQASTTSTAATGCNHGCSPTRRPQKGRQHTGAHDSREPHGARGWQLGRPATDGRRSHNIYCASCAL